MIAADTLQYWATRLNGEISRDENGQPVIRCPGPGHSADDRSLSVWHDDEAPQGFRVHSFAEDDFALCRDYVRDTCAAPGWKPRLKANGHAPPRDIVARYVYEDVEGRPRLQVTRYAPKAFAQAKPFAGGWQPGGIPEKDKVPFRLPELIEALAMGRTVYVVEGEKAALKLWSVGLPATCSSGGAGKWPKHFSAYFENANVIILSDRDAPGTRHAEQVRENLDGVAASVKVVALPGLKPGEDVFDWLAAGHDPGAIVNMVGDPQQPEAKPEPDRPPTFFHPWGRHPLPSFPLDCLSPMLRAFVVYQSRTLGADVNAIAMATLAALSGAVDHRFRLRLKRHTGWWVHPRVWVLMIGASSSKKTPIQRAVTRHHYRIEIEASADHAQAMARWQADQDAGPESPKPPPSMRLVVNDATPEAVGEILHRQDRGVLVLQDELSGFLGSLDRYGGGGNSAAAGRGFYLQAYNGGPMHRDRVGKGHQPIANCSVSFLAGVQDSFRGELGRLARDGLLQRFAVVAMAPATFPEDLPDEAGTELDYENLIRRLVRMEPRDLILSDGAMEATEALQRHLFVLEMKLEVGEAFTAFIGKLHGLHGNLMLLLHLADPQNEGVSIISADTAKAAAKIITGFVLRHGADFYGRDADGGEQDDLSKLAAHVLVGEADRYTVSDLAAGVPRLRGRPAAEIIAIASRLETLGWWDEGPARGGGIAWTLRSGLREALREQRAAKAAEAAAAMQAYREALRG